MPLLHRRSLPRVRRRPPQPVSDAHFYLRLAGVFALVLLAGLLSGLLIERNLLGGGDGAAGGFTDLDAVVDILDDSYYYRPSPQAADDVFDRQLQQDAITGMLGGLDDKYTTYLAPPDAERASNQLEGKAVGIGAEFSPHQGEAMIVRVFPETPAAAAGLRAGDTIARIDGQPVDASDWNRFVSDIQGDAGSTVRLTLRRPDQTGTFDVALMRREYTVPSVLYRMIEGTEVAWIQLSIFGSNTTAEIDAALKTVTDEGAKSVILDLRGNGGGWVTSAQEVIGRFVDPAAGPALYEDATPGDGGEDPMPILATGDAYDDVPLIVLTDGNTASAAEIVAGALQDYNRAIVVGERTFGKGSVQRVFEFKNGASLRVTFAEWLTPAKERIQDTGIVPDVEVAAGDANGATVDPMLLTAVQLALSGRTTPAGLAIAATPAA